MKYNQSDNLQNKATEALIGKRVAAFGVEEDPIQGIVNKISLISGLIIEVIIVDENKEKKVLDVKDKAVVLLPWIVRIVMTIAGLFKKK